MKSLQDVMTTIERTLKADPRPCCFACLGVASQEMVSQIEKHISENLSKVYTVEDGTCHKKDHHAKVIRPKDAGTAMPSYKDKG